MALLSELAARYDNEERPAGNLLVITQITAQLKAAARLYAGYAVLEAWQGVDPRPSDVTDSTPLSLSEFAVIRPLFLLYLERENAIQLEASRGMGVDPFGRQSSEVAMEIQQAEEALPLKAFFSPVVTI